MKPLRFFHTVRHLKPVQIYGRVLRSVRRPRPILGGSSRMRSKQGPWTTGPERRQSLMGPTEFQFLNKAGLARTREQWNDPAKAKLWLYNLHYFDDLIAVGAADRRDWHAALIDRWIAENPPGSGNGWEPYPLSLRIANWIKWSLAGAPLREFWVESLARQAHWLEQTIEWHLLGNHLLANAKALVMAGLFFEGTEAERWRSRGLDIYRRELDEQILADGGHYERSPMYHAILLEDLLDLANVAKVFDSDLAPLLRSVPAMCEWLEAMTHPDGEIAFFNDAAFGIASTAGDLRAYAQRLGLVGPAPHPASVRHLEPSGYFRVTLGGSLTAILDTAPVGPDYLPGHAHADTLSFELSIDSERVIVNGGTSRYDESRERQRERSTASHSTVVVDGEDSSEVWAAFRVARRARVSDVAVTSDGASTVISAVHDGYRRLPGHVLHRRNWAFSDRALSVTDELDGKFSSAMARFHLGEGVKAELALGGCSGTIHTARGRTLSFRTSHPAEICPSEWHPEFGKTVAVSCLVVQFAGSRLQTTLGW